MKYDKESSWVRSILRSADIMNTINGGMTQPDIKITRKEDHYLITARVPGVDLNTIKVEVVDKHVILHHALHLDTKEEDVLSIPRVLASFPISNEVDYEKITAYVEEELLKIVLPFNELSKGYHKNIQVNR